MLEAHVRSKRERLDAGPALRGEADPPGSRLASGPPEAAVDTISAPAVSTPAEPARWAVRCAHAVPLLLAASALWRLPFAFGFDMGLDDPAAPPWTWWAVPYTIGLILLVEALGMLTVGLVAPWGRTIPAWLPRIGGRPAHPTAVTVAATSGGVGLCLLWYGDLAVDIAHGGVRYEPTPWEVLGESARLTHLAWGPLLLVVVWDHWRRHRPARPPG